MENVCKVLVIGAGPAGIACADALASRGHSVTIYEKDSAAGGLLNIIPSTRFNKNALKAMLAKLDSKGVKIECGKNIDIDNLAPYLEIFDYIVIATGAQMSVKLDIENPVCNNVMYAVDYLKSDIKSNDVAVIGGGNVAMDCAVEAVNRGGKATVYYRKDKCDMKANPKEIALAEKCGVKFCFQTLDFNIPCDVMVIAIGQKPDVPKAVLSDRIIAVGDASTGPSTIADAIKHAKNAACLINPCHSSNPV